MKLLDDFSALHNLKQREGLNPVKAESVTEYLSEKRLIRTLQNLLEEEGAAALAEKADLSILAVTDVVEDYVYRLDTPELVRAMKLLDKDRPYDCIRYIYEAPKL